MTLYKLAKNEDLAGMLARIAALPRPHAINELRYRGVSGWTALHFALIEDCSLELLEAISDVMKDDPSKTNLFEVATDEGSFPLNFCACYTTQVSVLQFVIDKFPHAFGVVRRTSKHHDNSPLALARRSNMDRDNYAAILRCLEDNTARYPALKNDAHCQVAALPF